MRSDLTSEALVASEANFPSLLGTSEIYEAEANFPSLLGTSEIYEADLYFEYLAYALR